MRRPRRTRALRLEAGLSRRRLRRRFRTNKVARASGAHGSCAVPGFVEAKQLSSTPSPPRRLINNSRCTTVACSLDVDRLDVSPTQALSRSEEVLGASRAAASSRTPPRRVQRSARPFYDGVDAKDIFCRAHQIGGAAAVRFPSRVPKYNVTSYTHNRVHACGSERRRALRGSSRSIRRSPTACGPC